MPTLRTHRRESITEEVYFVTQDTYIFDSNHEDIEINPKLLRVGRGASNAISQTLIETYDYELSSEYVKVIGLKLCLYQYFAQVYADPDDSFQVNVVREDWDNNATAYSMPEIGEEIATIFFTGTIGKECFEFDADQRDKLRDSYGIIVSGGALSAKKERYFKSSRWIDGDKRPAEDPDIHPHWILTTQSDPATNTTTNSPKDFNKPINPNTPSNPSNPNNPNNQKHPMDGPPSLPTSDDTVRLFGRFSRSPYIALITGSFLCAFIIIAVLFYWRRKKVIQDENIKKLHPFNERSESFDDIFSVHEAQLKDLFQMRKRESGGTYVTRNNVNKSRNRIIEKHAKKSKKPSNPYETKVKEKHSSVESGLSSNMNQGKVKKKKSKLREKDKIKKSTSDLHRATSHTSQTTHLNKTRQPASDHHDYHVRYHDNYRNDYQSDNDTLMSNGRTIKSNLSSLSNSTDCGLSSLTTHEMLTTTIEDPCSINKVCLRVVERKECDIDYVAPGVASVVDQQCVNQRRHR